MSEHKVSSAVLADCMNMVSDARNGLRSAQASLESAAYKLKKEQGRLFKVLLSLEGRSRLDQPIDAALTNQNDGAINLVDAESSAAEDKEREYRRVVILIGKALEELEDE